MHASVRNTDFHELAKDLRYTLPRRTLKELEHVAKITILNCVSTIFPSASWRADPIIRLCRRQLLFPPRYLFSASLFVYFLSVVSFCLLPISARNKASSKSLCSSKSLSQALTFWNLPTLFLGTLHYISTVYATLELDLSSSLFGCPVAQVSISFT